MAAAGWTSSLSGEEGLGEATVGDLGGSCCGDDVSLRGTSKDSFA